MLFTLKHLLLTVALIGTGIFLPMPLLKGTGMPDGITGLCMFGGGAFTLFALGWPLYRLMHLRPIGLPPCLHCGKRHGNYHVPAEAWPCGILVCVSCGMPTRLYMSRKKPLDNKSDVPGLYLYWPEFVGIWRQVSP
jgi:hypothetical protein